MTQEDGWYLIQLVCPWQLPEQPLQFPEHPEADAQVFADGQPIHFWPDFFAL